MHVGKTLFAQVMEFVPWKTFGRIIERHTGDAGVRTLGCAARPCAGLSNCASGQSEFDAECNRSTHLSLIHI